MLFSSETEWVADKWYHIAVSYDTDGNGLNPGYNAFINGDRVSGNPDAAFFRSSVSSSYPAEGDREYYLGTGDLAGSSGGTSNFEGIIDEARWLNYEKNAFAGGLMISKVVPGTNTVTIYNSGDFSMNLAGVKIYNGGTSCTFSGTLAADDTDTCTLSVGSDDGIRMVDDDGDNSGGSDTGADEDAKDWITDGVCWNDGSGSDSGCDTSSDPLIDAGIWAEDTYVNMGSVDGIRLNSNGNNDEAVTDWAAIPEFGTLLMPIASVLLIVGYNYRRKEQLDS